MMRVSGFNSDEVVGFGLDVGAGFGGGWFDKPGVGAREIPASMSKSQTIGSMATILARLAPLLCPLFFWLIWPNLCPTLGFCICLPQMNATTPTRSSIAVNTSRKIDISVVSRVASGVDAEVRARMASRELKCIITQLLSI